jgi:hypothetical protein
MPRPGAHAPDAAAVAAALRLPVFSTVTALLGVGAHVAGGGALPGPGTIAVLGCVVALAGRPFTGRERSYPRLLVGVAVVQIGMHVALLDPADRTHAGHHAGSALSSFTTVLAHTAAVLLITWWLRRGEAATWRALRRVLPAWRVRPPVLATVPTGRLLPARAPLPFPAQLVVPGLPGRRGPPQG